MLSHGELQECFDLVPVTRPDDPCHYAFCIPNNHAFTRWPAFPMAARPQFGRVAAGRGVDAAQCRNSAFGEALELASACVWADEGLLDAPRAELGAAAISPSELNGHSPRQIEQRAAWNASPYGALDWRPAPCPADRTIAWVETMDVAGQACFIPADHVYVGRKEPGDDTAACIATTSGCAAAPTPEAAKAAALLELMERDAVGQWWYARQQKAPVALAEAALPGPVLRFLDARARRVILLDLTCWTGVPVRAAVSFDPDGTQVALGFGCDLQPENAARSAVVEMLQTEIGLTQRSRNKDPLTQIWLRKMHRNRLPITDRPSESAMPPVQTVPDLLDRLTSRDRRVAFVNLTRPQFATPVYRAIVPGLCSDKPRFAPFDTAGHPEPSKTLPLLV